MPWPAPTPLPIDDEQAPNYTIEESDATHRIEDDTDLEDENAQHTDKGKMYSGITCAVVEKAQEEVPVYL